MTAKRNRRAGVEDLWRKSDGAPSKLNGAGLRWRARYVDESGAERSKRFRAKAGAQTWLDSQTAAIVTGTYVARNGQRSPCASSRKAGTRPRPT